jgi:PhnB protein
MQLNPYLFFDGRCEEAFKFYESQLGGSIKAMMRYEGSPAEEHVPGEWRNKIMHATIEIGGEPLMGSDASPQHYHAPKGFSVSLAIDTVKEAERIFDALAEGGQVSMELRQTFWAARFGTVTDRFGIPWMINCEKDA